MEKSGFSWMATWKNQVPQNWKIFLVVTLILGALLRTIWGSDIEYKYDEHFMFERTQKVGVSEDLPLLGMPSGVGTRNPAMSIWVFLGLSRVFFAETPPDLARAVEVLNILALIGLLLFSLKEVDQKDRQTWFWAIALSTVNPLSILLQRKIWAQSTLPFFCFLLMLGWWKRDKAGGAFLLGLMGILLGQVHMSGFFFSIALLVWTLSFAKLLPVQKKIRWLPLGVGFTIGFIPLIPWLQYIIESHQTSTSFISFLSQEDRKAILSSLFWQHWITDPSGLGIWYSLGIKHFLEFLKYPKILDTSTYLVSIAHLCIIILLGSSLIQMIAKNWNTTQPLRIRWLGVDSESHFLLSSALWGFGLMISILGISIYRHYLIVAFPFEALWLAHITLNHSRKPHKVLALLWGCQLFIAISFLAYIHQNKGAPDGDYGIGYQFQGGRGH